MEEPAVSERDYQPNPRPLHAPEPVPPTSGSATAWPGKQTPLRAPDDELTRLTCAALQGLGTYASGGTAAALAIAAHEALNAYREGSK